MIALHKVMTAIHNRFQLMAFRLLYGNTETEPNDDKNVVFINKLCLLTNQKAYIEKETNNAKPTTTRMPRMLRFGGFGGRYC